jgi:UPF0042 nucleotide-binding protein
MHLVILSGLSGSGKTIALHALEDEGYYCIDNLPASILAETVFLLQNSGHAYVAIVIDARARTWLEHFAMQLKHIEERAIKPDLLYLFAAKETLMRRYRETRRRHPLSDGVTNIGEAIEREDNLLQDLAAMGTRLDTSFLSAGQLRQWIKQWAKLPPQSFFMVIESFGFKNGVPLDADFVFDVRFLPNPHYEPLLSPLTGLDQAVIDFFQQDPMVRESLEQIVLYLCQVLPKIRTDGRASLHVALGCTGGKHRSVYLAQTLAKEMRHVVPALMVRHREIGKDVAS